MSEEIPVTPTPVAAAADPAAGPVLPRQTARDGGRMDLTSGPITKTLIIFALPTLASNILQTLSGSVNSIWVGQFLGERAAQAGDDLQQVRVKDRAHFHVCDEVAAALVEAQHHTVAGPAGRHGGAAAGAGRDGDDWLDIDTGQAALLERNDDLLALPVAIGVGFHVLEGATAADAEVAAGGIDAVRAPFDDADDIAAIGVLLDRNLFAFQRVGHERAVGGFAVALVANAQDVKDVFRVR